MGRAIDMENDIINLKRRLDTTEAALEKVINWISDKESKDGNKKQRKSTTVKKSAKASNKVSDVPEGVK
jgi:hypothetical protein